MIDTPHIPIRPVLTRLVEAGPVQRQTIRGTLLVAGVLLAASFGGVGCSRSGGIGDTSSLTGGVDLAIESRDTEAHRIVAITVQTDGRITFAGGRDAISRREGWVGQLTPEQATELRSILDRDGWFAGTVTSSGEPRSRIFRVTILGGPDGRRRYDLRGASPEAVRLETFLEGVSRDRFGDFMQRLPEAGDRPR